MIQKDVWKRAEDAAMEEYEEENGYGSWEYADKYEREDLVHSKYEYLVKTYRLKTNNKENKKENKTMTKRNERMNTLETAGINTGKFFNVTLPEGLQPGATIQLVINESGQPIMVPVNANGIVQEMDYTETDPILNQIITDGYVKNTKLHRRWVMAQMFQMLNFEYRNNKERIVYSGYSDYVNYVLPYKYQFNMMLEEVRVLSKLEERDWESFVERSHFFTKEVVVATCEDYITKLEEHVNRSKTRHCKGVPYKTVGGKDVFVSDLHKKVYAPYYRKLVAVKGAKNYAELYRALSRFMHGMVKLPAETKKCKEWVDAYKGSGSYYTCKNLIMFHGCQVLTKEKRGYSTINYWMTRTESMKELKDKLKEYKGEGWRMHAFMKKLIADNEFDFQSRMNEIYNK